MIRPGRPKDISKSRNRKHSVILTDRAELIFQTIEKKQGTKWFNAWVSKNLCDQFPIDDDEAFWVKEMTRRNAAMLEAQDAFEAARIKLEQARQRKSGVKNNG